MLKPIDLMSGNELDFSVVDEHVFAGTSNKLPGVKFKKNLTNICVNAQSGQQTESAMRAWVLGADPFCHNKT